MMRFTSIQQVLSQMQTISVEVLAKNAAQIDQNYEWPQEAMRRFQADGLAGLVIPKEYGGLGHGLLALAQSCEVLGRECASTSMCFGMHCVGSAVIAAKATQFQKEHFLKPIAEGHHITGLALSEPGSGANFFFPESKITYFDKNEFEITGKKSFVTNGGHADSYIISAVIQDSLTSLGKFSCVVVPKETPNMDWLPAWKGIGMRGNSSREVHLNKARIEKKFLLGEEGDQIWYVFEIITPYFLMAIAGTYLGVAQSALNILVQHVKKRRHTHSGMILGQHQLIQHRVGVLWGKIESCRQLIYNAAILGDQKSSNAILSIISAKASIADCVNEVISDVMQMMGGISYANDSTLGRMLRDSKAAHIMAPTTDTLRIWAGRSVLGLPLIGED